MPFNLLLFPLVGGYYFLIFSRTTKYYHQRIDSQKLIFNSILIGIVFLTTALVCTSILQSVFPDASRKIKYILPFHEAYTGTAIISFILSIMSAHISNLFIKNTTAICNSINEIGDDLEKLIKEAFIKKSLICITLDSDKIYVGWPISVPKPSKSNYISMLPVFSGYRDERKNLKFTTEYLDVYFELLKEGKSNDLNDLGFLLVISSDQIISANLFDITIYERFF